VGQKLAFVTSCPAILPPFAPKMLGMNDTVSYKGGLELECQDPFVIR
jgi:hypothetical protein